MGQDNDPLYHVDDKRSNRSKCDFVYGVEKPPLSTWEAVRQAQLAELLQANLLYELGFFYNKISGIGDKFVRYSEFTDSEVLPLLKTGTASFYLEDRSRLLPRFEAHMDRLREWNDVGRDIIQWATCLLDRLESPDNTTKTCRIDVGDTAM